MQCTHNLIIYVGVSRSYPTFFFHGLLVLIITISLNVSDTNANGIIQFMRMNTINIFANA